MPGLFSEKPNRVLEPVHDLAQRRISALKLNSKAHILQYAVLFRPVVPFTASIDQDLEQVHRLCSISRLTKYDCQLAITNSRKPI